MSVLPKRAKRLCPKCGEEKPLTITYWHRNKAHASGWATYCKPCMITLIRGYQGKHAAKLRALKEADPCLDCGIRYPFYIMQYDHRPGEIKSAEVGKMAAGSYTWDRILAEIAKCDLVCANCHAERTWLRASGLEVS